jgi:hypothetical protein
MTYGSDIYATHPRPHSFPPPPPPLAPRTRHVRQDILRTSARPSVVADPHSNAVAAELVRSISRVLTTVDEERRVLVEAQERRREAEVENAALRSELNLERVLRLRTEAELRRLRHNFVPPLPRPADFERARARTLRDASDRDQRGLDPGPSGSIKEADRSSEPPAAPSASTSPANSSIKRTFDEEPPRGRRRRWRLK